MDMTVGTINCKTCANREMLLEDGLCTFCPINQYLSANNECLGTYCKNHILDCELNCNAGLCIKNEQDASKCLGNGALYELDDLSEVVQCAEGQKEIVISKNIIFGE